jgi:hypothetical protein
LPDQRGPPQAAAARTFERSSPSSRGGRVVIASNASANAGRVGRAAGSWSPLASRAGTPEAGPMFSWCISRRRHPPRGIAQQKRPRGCARP